MRRRDVRFEIAPYDYAAARRLAAELDVPHALAQVLVRRGLGEARAARAFLDADVAHGLDEFGGLADAAARILGHVEAGSRVTVHGDYDADGACATAILARVLRTLGADVDWYLPSRVDDGYGLSAATVERLAARGTRLLITADCAITAVEEVAAARALGLDVVVTDHHAPRADGRLPDAPLVHPGLAGYPCPDLCAAGVAYKLAGALLAAAGLDPALADEDLDLVALATVADCVPLLGENRRLVRAGLRKLAMTRKPGLQALLDVSRLDPGDVDATAIGFRLAPRINAAGRVRRADAALELLLTTDAGRARAVAAELDRCNVERRDVETRILFEAEAQASQAGDAPALVLAGEGWHPGVIGIVASRIAERHHRPAVLIALDGEAGTGSGRSIPAFDLLGGLDAASEHLLRHGGHRAAAGLSIARERVDAFRAAFVAHAAAVLAPEDLVPVARIDAVVPGDELGLSLAEQLARLEPVGQGNPAVSLLVAAATLSDPRPMGEGRHVACTLTAGGARSRLVAFGGGTRLPAAPGEPVDVAVRLEANRFNGFVEPRLVLRHARPPAGAPIELLGEPASFAEGVRAELARALDEWPLAAAPPSRGERELLDHRGRGVAGLLADLVAAGDPVLVACAHARHRERVLRERLGGFALVEWAALEDDPALAAGFTHLVVLDPPAHSHQERLLRAAPGKGWAHVAWGAQELGFARRILQWNYALRAPLIEAFRGLRAAGTASGAACEALLRGDGPQPRSPALAGRLVRVLAELQLAAVDPTTPAITIGEAQRTELERSPAYRAYRSRLEDGIGFLSRSTSRAAA